MDNLLAYIILLAPGLIVMLINDRVGSDLKGKYTNTERIVMAILLSIPVLICNLFFLGLKKGSIAEANITVLQNEIQSLGGLLFFSITSILIALVVYNCWQKSFKKVTLDLVNKFRTDAGKAEVNGGSVVWDDAFHGSDPQALCVVLKDTKSYGSPIKSSEVISDERCLLLKDCKTVEDVVVKYNVPIINTYIDTKSGIAIHIYDPKEFLKAYNIDSTTTE